MESIEIRGHKDLGKLPMDVRRAFVDILAIDWQKYDDTASSAGMYLSFERKAEGAAWDLYGVYKNLKWKIYDLVQRVDALFFESKNFFDAFFEHCADDIVVVHAGMFAGTFLLLSSMYKQAVSLYGYAPVAEHVQWARNNLSLNLKDRTVYLEQAVVGLENGTTEIEHYPNLPEWSGLSLENPLSAVLREAGLLFPAVRMMAPARSILSILEAISARENKKIVLWLNIPGKESDVLEAVENSIWKDKICCILGSYTQGQEKIVDLMDRFCFAVEFHALSTQEYGAFWACKK